MNTFKLKLLAAQIELDWWFIIRQRRKGNALIEAGLPFSSPKLNKLNRSYSNRCAKALKAQSKYENALALIRG